MFEKEEEEEVKCKDSGISFVACNEEEKARVVQEDISMMMKRHGEDMGDKVKAASKEARAGFNKAANTDVDEAV